MRIINIFHDRAQFFLLVFELGTIKYVTFRFRDFFKLEQFSSRSKVVLYILESGNKGKELREVNHRLS